MNAYTISKLANDADVSVHIVRDYQLRGILHPCQRSKNGYRIYDQKSLQRLQFILAGKAAGISLNSISQLCFAMDNNETNVIEIKLQSIKEKLEEYKITIQGFEKTLLIQTDILS